jgi:hypothetical protein
MMVWDLACPETRLNPGKKGDPVMMPDEEKDKTQ